MKRWQEGPGYHVLLVLLLGLVLIVPMVERAGRGELLLETALLFVLFQAFTVVCQRPHQRVVGLILFVPGFVHWLLLGDSSLIRAFPELRSSGWVQASMAIGAALFLFYLVFLTVAYILRGRQVSWNQISAAASSYLLLGLAWKLLYEYLLWLDPGCIDGLTRVVDDGGLVQGRAGGELIYFSFVTMTTLGYGDIVPVSVAARMLVVLQAVVGQLFLVILLARLVGMVGMRGDPPAESA